MGVRPKSGQLVPPHSRDPHWGQTAAGTSGLANGADLSKRGRQAGRLRAARPRPLRSALYVRAPCSHGQMNCIDHHSNTCHTYKRIQKLTGLPDQPIGLQCDAMQTIRDQQASDLSGIVPEF
ncbi:hypothetical protein PAHAL_1G089700 [Panicum hallii]|nr:hypothetical protein PAHAL_1G089700 [Panicum hallii]